MRRLIALAGLMAVALMLLSQAPAMSQAYEEGEVDAWQALAETYYTEEGIANPNFYWDNAEKVASGELTARYAFRGIDIPPGIIVPDFTLNDFEGVSHSLSDYKGNFILLNNGSWY